MKIVFCFIALFILGCAGYEPISKLNKSIFKDEIYAEVIVDKKNPRNSIQIQNSINQIIISKFDAKISKNPDATNMIIETKNISFEPISYDQNGYIVAYQSIVELGVTYNKETTFHKGTFNFNIEAESSITESKRFQAIKEASSKAIDSFISAIIVKSL
ncbi:MAG: Unknown protein [uncultured Campylobacterales bacterium]|uniref:Uncharacterized protein n=1 Tax=uncultured Campylobacterales bacterium TaxID=352960 RepID=A0A6S6SYL3_9BACT|nr:MAG: Unknown protein [uncultured Campylobacterales bacterium]